MNNDRNIPDGRTEPAPAASRALELRQTFDASFAAPRALGRAELEKLIVLQVGALQLACRVQQITRIEANRKVVPLSDGAPGLVGIAGIRGKLVPVYSLATVLGIGGGKATPWLAICGDEEPIAFSFDRLERYVHAPAGDLCAVSEGAELAGHMRELLRTSAATYQVLDLDSVLLAIRSKLAV